MKDARPFSFLVRLTIYKQFPDLPIRDKGADFGDTVGGGGNVEGGGQGPGGGRGGRLHATRRLKQRISSLTTVRGVSRGRLVYRCSYLLHKEFIQGWK